ncbi:MAG: aryl-sulfate sulfotransferase [Bacteroidales bacterium]|nr:aryl-sulfate sulfotransferase [Bacteroidales bacterium]
MKRICSIVVLLILSSLFTLHISGQNTVGVLLNKENAVDGYTLFAVHNRTYLINNEGEIVNQWKSNYSVGQSVYLLENGNLLRSAEIEGPGRFTMPSVGGRVELFDWDSKLIWEYNYSTSTATQHHDIYPMPGGNVLILAIEVINGAEAIQMGRKRLTPPFKQLYNEQILELRPKSSNDADVVWEWNVKDHVIQDFNRAKDNYGIISENPQRLDVNYLGSTSGGANWIHINSVQYNAELDQIALTSKHLSEIYIIDHSTTTAEAATSSGGNYNKGGDFLYRWGNPFAYKQGTVKDQKLFGPHYTHWIGKGLKDAGKIIVFNNGEHRVPKYSEVFIITPPASAPGKYIYKANTAFAPASPDYIYTAPVNTNFYSPFKSSAQRLPGGHMLVCEGEKGRFFELDENEKIVWEYISPVGASKILSQGEDPATDKTIVFRVIKYTADYKAFEGKDLTPGLAIEKPPQ